MTSFSLSSSLGVRGYLLGALLLAAGCTTVTPPPPAQPAPAAPAAEPKTAAVEGAFEDDPRPPSAGETLVSAAALDPQKLAAAQSDLLARLLDPANPPAARQEAAQLLGLVVFRGPPADHAATLATLGRLLADPATVDYARLVLDRVEWIGVDPLYVQALPALTGRARLGLLDAIGTRRIAEAVPAIAPLLADADPATVAAAARALGHIRGPAALAALDQAKDPLSPVVLTARLSASRQTPQHREVPEAIYRNPAAPLAARTAALRQLISLPDNTSGGLDEIHEALAGSDKAFHAVVIESVATLAIADADAKLAARMSAYTPEVQVRLIGALGHRGQAGAVPALVQALDHADAAVRLAATEALGRLPGTPEVAQRLAVLAASGGPEAKTAFDSLARLNGPAIDGFIRAGAAAAGEPAQRIVFIQQLAARNQTEAIPFLLDLRTSPVESLRLEALDALRAIAGAADQPALIAWALAAPKAEQNRAVRALITIILRDGNVATRAATVVAAINTGDPAAQLALLPILSRVAGPAALAAAGNLGQSPDAAVAKAATAELARWPDASVLPVLGDLAVRSTQDSIRKEAVQGATRFLAQNTVVSRADRSVHTRALLALPLDLPARLGLLNVLSLCEDQAALDTARSFLTDPATAALAQDAVDAITSNLAGPPKFTASTAPETAVRVSDGKLRTFWSAPIVPGEWLRADLHHARPVHKLTLEHGAREWDFPASVDVFLSDDPDQPGPVRVTAEGTRYRTIVTLPEGSRGRYLLIRQTGTRSGPWAIAELLVE